MGENGFKVFPSAATSTNPVFNSLWETREAHRMNEVERDLKTHPVLTSLGLLVPHQLRLPRAPSMAMGPSRDGASTAPGSGARASPPY